MFTVVHGDRPWEDGDTLQDDVQSRGLIAAEQRAESQVGDPPSGHSTDARVRWPGRQYARVRWPGRQAEPGRSPRGEASRAVRSVPHRGRLPVNFMLVGAVNP